MPAAKRDLYVEQGATFRLGFNWYGVLVDLDGNPVLDGNGDLQPGGPVDLTGATARMQIRQTLVGSPLLEATTANGRIVLGTTNGRVDIKFPASVTDLLTQENAVYDLEISLPDPGEFPSDEPDVQRVLEGNVRVSLNVTRSA